MTRQDHDQPRRLPDLVRDAQLPVRFISDGIIEHTVYTSNGQLRRKRRTQTEESWQRQRELGNGTFGRVWLEKCLKGPAMGSLRAVKELRKHENIDYTRELEAMAKFSHDNYVDCFVKCYGWYISENAVFIAMEYLENGDLEKCLTRPFPESEAQAIICQIVEGLGHMHQNGFAHRDIKPSNILICQPGPDWWVKIGDFGISKRAEEDNTALRTLLGTEGYLAPEILGFTPLQSPSQSESFSYTFAVDIWALGEMSFRMITQRPAFPNRRDLFNHVVNGHPFPVEELTKKGATKGCCDFIMKTMVANPDHRLHALQALSHIWMQVSRPPTRTSSRSSIESFRAQTIRSGTQSLEKSASFIQMQPDKPDIFEDTAKWTTLSPGSENLKTAGDASSFLEDEHKKTLFPHAHPEFPVVPSPTTAENISCIPAPLNLQRHDNTKAPGPPKLATSKPSRSRTIITTPSGNWILGKTIGIGSESKVKLAMKEDGTEEAACKIIRSHADNGPVNVPKEIQTIRELTAMLLLNHPHICSLRGFTRTNNHYYFFFEYISGGDMLDYMISYGKMKESRARRFSRQIASALDYCHRNSIVHRDLKLENLLITKSGDIKIIDFGGSNMYTPGEQLLTCRSNQYFSAPEILQNKPYSGPMVDVWSFGIIMYTMVCGRVPFDDSSIPALHAKLQKGLVEYPSWLSIDCKDLLSRILVTDPAQRINLLEVLNHPWMCKGFQGPPDNYFPSRTPLTLPLDLGVIRAIQKLQDLTFGSVANIHDQLTNIILSKQYKQAVQLYEEEREKKRALEAEEPNPRKFFGFSFFKKRLLESRDARSSNETLPVGVDPLNAYHPLLSTYYLMLEELQSRMK